MDNSYTKLSSIEVLLYKQLYKKSLYDFVKDFWECCDPSKIVDGYLIQFYCECFQYFCKDWIGYDKISIDIPEEFQHYKVIDVRQNKRNLCINVPPRHSKTMVFNVIGPVWLWLTYPIKAASISHTFGLSKDINSKRQRLINSEKFKFFFGDDFSLISNTTDSLKDNRGGELYSKNRDAMTGFGCDFAICDDITNAETARKDQREMLNAWSFFQNTLPSRINDIKKGVIINIQQRLAPGDITGKIMSDRALSKEYCFIVIPAEFEEDTILVCPISGDIIVYKKGNTLWPERFGDYKSLRAQVGESVYQTQYLQHPVATDRTVIRNEMIIEKDLTEVPLIDQADAIYGSHDVPVKDKETSDFFGSIVAYKINSTIYIKDCLEKRMAFVKSVEYVENLSQAYTGIIQIIEDKANGSPIIQQLQDKVPGIQAFQPGTQSKMQRLESASIYMNAGNIVFVKDQFDPIGRQYHLSEALENLKQKLLNFPFVEHDDIVDAFSQLILYVYMDRRYMVYGRSFNEYNIIDYKPQQGEYTTVFFNREGDLWKVCEIAVRYGEDTKLIVTRDIIFKASSAEGLKLLKEFGKDKNVFIDSSDFASFYGAYTEDLTIEKYDIEDFAQSVGALNLKFGNKTVLVNKSCKGVKADIDSFKYDKSKDDSMTFKTEKDGFVACIRVALKYYGL